MQCLTSLVWVPLVVLISLTVETFATDQYAPIKLSNPVAKEVMQKLQDEIGDLEELFQNYFVEFYNDNELLPAVKAYRAAYASSKHTDCAGEAPPGGDDDDLYMAYLNDCEEASPSNDMAVFVGKVEQYKAKVKKIDDNLKKTCISDPKTCEQSKTEAEAQLNDIVTPELDEELKGDAKTIFSTFKTKLNTCFNRDSAELIKDLRDGVKAINECMAKRT